MQSFPELYNSNALHALCTLTLMALPGGGGGVPASLSHQSMLEHDCRRSCNPPIRGRLTGPPQTSVHLLTRLKEIKSWKRSSLVISFVQNLVGESVLVQTLYEVNLFRYQGFPPLLLHLFKANGVFFPCVFISGPTFLYILHHQLPHFDAPVFPLFIFISPSSPFLPSRQSVLFPALGGGKGLRGSSTALCFHCQSSIHVNHIDLGRFLHFTGYYMLSLSCVYVWNGFPLELTKIPELSQKVPLADEYHRWGGTLGRTCDQTPSSAYGHSF